MKCLIVYNSFSGKGINEKKLNYIINRISVAYTTDIFRASGKGSIKEYILNLKDIYDLFIILGGDGTIHTVVNAIKRLSYVPKVACIPTGTMNDMAKTLGMKKNLKKSMNIILKGKTMKKSLLVFNDEYTIYGAATGRYSDVAYTQDKKNGKISYYLRGLKQLFRSKAVKVKIDGQDKEYSQIFILDTNYMANFKMNALNTDECVHMFCIKKSNGFLDTFKFLFFLLSKGKRSIHISKESFLIDGAIFTLDGEKYEHKCLKITKDSVGIPFICK